MTDLIYVYADKTWSEFQDEEGSGVEYTRAPQVSGQMVGDVSERNKALAEKLGRIHNFARHTLTNKITDALDEFMKEASCVTAVRANALQTPEAALSAQTPDMTLPGLHPYCTMTYIDDDGKTVVKQSGTDPHLVLENARAEAISKIGGKNG